ncbi:neutral cholesterol ester hydrolase 1a [Oryzias melastigma]|uniref:Neutral cholesterol ester hydrolase 1a n=1 Tax=Oryzias melastigma TaxID=30732 RepID=A0A3B3DPS8_ORYME|nr:neutral cholesterol ester hydrolase 1a [Oryzias melastigma]
MGRKVLVVTVLLTVAVAYYVYKPLPDAIEKPWKLMMLDAIFRSMMHLGFMKEYLVLSHYISSVRSSVESIEGFTTSSESREGVIPGVKFTDTTFAGVPVRVYEPPAGGEGHLRRGLMYLHGGGWAFGSGKGGAYDSISHRISDELNCVVVSVDYRLYPAVHFPEPFLDCFAAAKHFLSPEVLARYAIDPERVAVSGDSAGGNLAAAVAQEISADDGVQVKFSVQALIYPALQALDFNTPSYVQNQNMAVLSRHTMVMFWLQYLNGDLSLLPQVIANNHSASRQSALTAELRSRVDWTVLLPPKFRKNHSPLVVEKGSQEILKKVPGLLDTRAVPLLAEAAVLAKCPRAYILTCEYDVLRDDGLMYAQRLRDVGVSVSLEHLEDGFHGAFSFITWPMDFEVGKRAVRSYITWLQNNL